MGSPSHLQEIFPTQGLNPSLLQLLHWQADSLLLRDLASLQVRKTKLKQKPNRHSGELQAKNLKCRKQKQGTAHTPCTQHHKGWANCLSHLSSPTPAHTPTFTPSMEGMSLPPLRESASKGTYFFASSCSQHRSPSKPLLEFLVWSLVNFYWLGKSKHPGQYQFYCLRWFQDEKEHDLHPQGVEGLIGKHVTRGSEITTKKKGLRKLEELKDLLIGKRDRVSRRTWHLCWTSQDKSTGDTWDPHWNIYCVTGCLRHPSWKTKPEYIGD